MLTFAAAAMAQSPGQPSLVDVARQTEASRASATAKKAQKIYTNKDLHHVPTEAPASTETAAQAPEKNAAAKDAAQPGEKLSAAEEAKLNAVPEAMWRARAGRIREQAAALQDTLVQVRARPKNPNPARQEQNDKEEARMLNAIAALKKQWDALEGQARLAKIDLTWLDPIPAFPQ